MNENKLCLITFSNNHDHQQIVYNMFEALTLKGIDVSTIGIENPKYKSAPHTRKNHYYPCPVRPGICKGTFRFRVLFQIARMIRDEQIQYLYFESLHLWNFFLMLLCRKCVKIEVVHDVIPHSGTVTVSLCTFAACHSADAVVLVDNKYRDTFIRRYKVRSEKVKVFPFWKSFPEKRKPTFGGKFLFFGRIRRYKGIDLLDEIISKTPEIHYQIVGEPDQDSKVVIEGIRKYANVEIVDREVSESEMEAFFSGADWLILPYRTATQSGIVMDAYRYSRPVIAFRVGSIENQVEDGKTGYLVETGNTEAFAAAIRRAAQLSREQTEAFASQAYDYGHDMYAAEALADGFLAMVYSIK